MVAGNCQEAPERLLPGRTEEWSCAAVFCLSRQPTLRRKLESERVGRRRRAAVVDRRKKRSPAGKQRAAPRVLFIFLVCVSCEEENVTMGFFFKNKLVQIHSSKEVYSPHPSIFRIVTQKPLPYPKSINRSNNEQFNETR